MSITALPEAFEDLLERYAALLRRFIADHCPKNLGLQISEIEQDARVRLWRALTKKRQLVNPASYIYRIAVSTTIDAVRRVLARREDQLVDHDDDGEDATLEAALIDSSRQPDALAEGRQLLQRIAAAISSLPENRRRAVELHLHGFELREIAARLGWSEAKVRNLVYRGLSDLREMVGVDVEPAT